jgi:hypothetical protein
MANPYKFRRPLSARTQIKASPQRTGFWWQDSERPRRKKRPKKLSIDEQIRRELEAEKQNEQSRG